MVRRSPASRIVGGILKAVAAALVGMTVGVILWRVLFSANPPGSVSRISPNDELAAAFRENGEELSVYWQKQYTTTLAEKNKGYFTVTRAYFFPDADQVQLIFRYNNSTLEHLAADYGLDGVPEKSGTYFDLTVVIRNRDGSETRYHPDPDPVRDETSLYTYFRVTFRGISVTEETEAVFLDVYYNEDICYPEKAYGTLCLYSSDAVNQYVSLPRADREALREFEN